MSRQLLTCPDCHCEKFNIVRSYSELPDAEGMIEIVCSECNSSFFGGDFGEGFGEMLEARKIDSELLKIENSKN